MAVVKTYAKGQIMIPKNLRVKLGILPGRKVSLRLVDDHLELRPLPDDPIEFLTTCRIDTPVEIQYYRNGGILHTVLRNMLKGCR